MIKFYLNGIEKSYSGDPELPLLIYLRDHENILSVKNGCSPQAVCGSCTVELNKKAILSCRTPMRKVANGKLITTEGMDDLVKNAFVTAFAEKGAVQCGFCIPGIVMRAKILLQKYPNPSRAEIRESLRNHICRCTGFIKIIEAIEYAALAIRNREFIKYKKGNSDIGSRYPKYKVEQIIMGLQPFVSDIKFENMCHAALKFSDYPRARIVSIDIRPVERLEGVIRVFTAKDVPGDRYIGLIMSDWPIMIDEGETTHYVGDVLAGVIAENEEIARRAVDLITVEYDVLEPVTDVFNAMEKTSDRVHDGKDNILDRCVIKRGDVDLSISESDYVVQRIYKTQTIEHGYLEPEACIAKPWKDGLEIFSQGQGVYEDRRQISKILNLPEDKINVRQEHTGGAFGGKEDLLIQGQTALFAFLSQRAVKLVLNRKESIRMHPKRHPMFLDYTLGCNRNGKLTALKARIIGDTGAYASVGTKVLERAAGHSTGAYMVPSVDVESTTVYTNNIPNGAMRGFGTNQVNFALECCIDEICEMGKFDRWQFRYKNVLKKGDMTASGQILKDGVGIQETLKILRPIYAKAKYAGIACGIKNTGIGNAMVDASTVKIKIFSARKVIISHGWCEMGQGINTMAVQILCKETGINPDIIEVKVQTDDNTPAGMTTASRATSLLGNAIIDACNKMKADLKKSSLSDLRGRVYDGSWICDWTTKLGDVDKEVLTHYSYSYATQLIILNESGKIDAVYAAHDAGKIMNRSLFEGQIHGAIHMGLGYALKEKFEYKEAIPKSYRLKDCGILRARDVPKIVVYGLEVKDPIGPYGAKGVGEIGLVPTAPAMANALYQYDGKRRYSLPMDNYQSKE